MSVRITNRVWEHSKQKGTSRLMLLAIADNANDDGIAWPGMATLAHKMGDMSRRAAGNRITDLAQTTELAVYPQAGSSHDYIVTVGMTRAQVKRAIKLLAAKRGVSTRELARVRRTFAGGCEQSSQVNPSPGAQETSQPGAQESSQGVAASEHKPAHERHEPSVEPSNGAGAPQSKSQPAKSKPAAREKGKPRQPRERSDLEKAVIEGSFGIPGDNPLGKDEGYLVGRLVDWLKKNAPGEKADDVRLFYRWFAQHYPGASAPRDRAKFGTHYRAYMASRTTYLDTASPVSTVGAPEIEVGPEYSAEERERIIRLLKEARNGKQSQPASA